MKLLCKMGTIATKIFKVLTKFQVPVLRGSEVYSTPWRTPFRRMCYREAVLTGRHKQPHFQIHCHLPQGHASPRSCTDNNLVEILHGQTVSTQCKTPLTNNLLLGLILSQNCIVGWSSSNPTIHPFTGVRPVQQSEASFHLLCSLFLYPLHVFPPVNFFHISPNLAVCFSMTQAGIHTKQ